MSIYLRVEKFAAEAKLIQIRSIHAAIGEDQNGILTSKAPDKTFFSVFAFDSQYIIKAEIQGLRINDNPLNFQESIALRQRDQVAFDDYTFSCFTTSNKAEILAVSDESLELLDSEELHSTEIPQLIFQLANLRRSFPLFTDLEISLGSSRNAAIHIDLPQVAEMHYSITGHNNTVLVKPLTGSIAVNDQTLGQEQRVSTDTSITLLPCGLEMVLAFPAKTSNKS